MELTVLWFCILALQVGFTLKVVFLVVSFLQSQQWSLHSTLEKVARVGKHHRTQFLTWWKQTGPTNSRRDQELDRMRCNWIRVVWPVILFTSMLRLFVRQLQLYHGEQNGGEFDYALVVIASFALVLTSCPCLINPRCQDVWYLASMLTIDATVLISVAQGMELDVRDVIALAFPGRFTLAVLAKRAPCVICCMLFHLAQALAIVAAGSPCSAAISVHSVASLFLIMLVSIMGVRGLLRNNAFLKADLQERTVELRAVSSLLTPCYDAVVEVDHSLRLTHDSRQLSSLLLSAPKPGGLSGEAFLDFFTERDRLRISEQVLSSKRSGTENPASTSVVALNAEMLDSDHNPVKVELLCAQFRNLADEKCFLVGLREIQDTETIAGAVADVSSHDSGPSAQALTLASDDALMVLFDMYHFHVYSLSGKMQQLCHQCLGVSSPGSVLEIASSLSQLSFNRQLQTLGNTFAAQQQADPGTVAFNLLGLWEADGFVTCEYDQVLDAHVGSMVVVKRAIIPSTLTQSNLQNLDESRGNQSSDSLGFVALTLGQAHSRRSSRSSRSGSSPSRSKRFNRSQQPASPFQGSGCTERGAISALHELRLDSKACL